MMKALHAAVLIAAIAAPTTAAAREIGAASAAAIKRAVGAARPGDVILIKPGEYDMGGGFGTGRSGARGRPVTMRAAGAKGYAVLKVRGTVGFRVRSRHWVLSGLHVKGDGRTQATVFMDGPGGAGDVHIIDCKISGSASHGMKASRSRTKAVNNVLIEFTELFNTKATGFDLVSGDNWTLRRNYVHDYGTGGGVCYGIFLKGGGRKGIIEGNLIDGGGRRTTVGISFGGGKTGKKWLPLVGGKVAAEHDGGICRNNVVVSTADVAYHSNNAANCAFYNNLAYKCSGFQRQSSYKADPLLVNNVLGRLRGADPKSRHNLGAGRKEWFVNPDKHDFRLTPAGVKALAGKGVHVKDNPTDLFGTKRDPARPVLGPVLPGAKDAAVWIDRRK